MEMFYFAVLKGSWIFFSIIMQKHGLSYKSNRNLLNVLPLRTASPSFPNFQIHFEIGQRRKKKFHMYYAEYIMHWYSSSSSIFLEIWLVSLCYILLDKLLIFSTCFTKTESVYSLSKAMRLVVSKTVYSFISRFYVLAGIYSCFFFCLILSGRKNVLWGSR